MKLLCIDTEIYSRNSGFNFEITNYLMIKRVIYPQVKKNCTNGRLHGIYILCGLFKYTPVWKICVEIELYFIKIVHRKCMQRSETVMQ